MNLLALVALSLGMSMDAFAAAIAKGSACQRVSVPLAIKVGITFGVIEATTPLIGYFLGVLAQSWVSQIDHWIAFGLLLGLGVNVLYHALRPTNNKISNNNWSTTILTAVATSIDAMVIGISLAFLDVNIWLACLLIGIATTIMATLGMILGATIGQRIGKIAEILGGVSLIAIGLFILLTHLGFI